MTDIPTPETDAAVYLAVAFPTHTKRADANNQNEVVLADFARSLERRLAAATAEVKLTAIRCSNLEEAISAIMPSEELTALVASLRSELAAATARAEEAETRLFEQVEALRSMTGATETETPMFKARALLSELDRLRKEREWQPIETAPKDGTRVLIDDRQLGIEIASWRQTCWTGGFKWIVEDDRSDTVCAESPTHWMPLPDAPQEEGEA